jgi:hypothetical protein
MAVVADFAASAVGGATAGGADCATRAVDAVGTVVITFDLAAALAALVAAAADFADDIVNGAAAALLATAVFSAAGACAGAASAKGACISATAAATNAAAAIIIIVAVAFASAAAAKDVAADRRRIPSDGHDLGCERVGLGCGLAVARHQVGLNGGPLRNGLLLADAAACDGPAKERAAEELADAMPPRKMAGQGRGLAGGGDLDLLFAVRAGHHALRRRT